MLSNHKEMKLEISNKKKLLRHTNMWNLNNTFLNKQCVKEEKQKKNQKILLKLIKMKKEHTKNL